MGDNILEQKVIEFTTIRIYKEDADRFYSLKKFPDRNIAETIHRLFLESDTVEGENI